MDNPPQITSDAMQHLRRLSEQLQNDPIWFYLLKLLKTEIKAVEAVQKRLIAILTQNTATYWLVVVVKQIVQSSYM